MGKAVKWGSIIVFWLVVFIVVAELVLRQNAELQSWSEQSGGIFQSVYTRPQNPDSWLLLRKPGFDTIAEPEFTFVMPVNEEGLIDVTHPKEKPDGEYRIVALGDSYTEGYGATFGQSWPMQWQQLLNADTAHTYRVINGGVASSDPWHEYHLLRERLMEYQPDLVLVSINATDILDMKARGGIERFHDDGTTEYKYAPWWEPLFARSYLLRFWVLNVLKYDWFYHNATEKEIAESTAIQGIINAVVAMHEMSEIISEADFAVVFHPTAGELQSHKYTEGLLLPMDACREMGIHSIDLLPYFEKHIPQDSIYEYYWERDLHHNARGYALFAEGVEEGLMVLGVLDELYQSDSLTADSVALVN